MIPFELDLFGKMINEENEHMREQQLAEKSRSDALAKLRGKVY